MKTHDLMTAVLLGASTTFTIFFLMYVFVGLLTDRSLAKAQKCQAAKREAAELRVRLAETPFGCDETPGGAR